MTDVAVGIALQSCLQAEVRDNQYLLPLMAAILDFSFSFTSYVINIGTITFPDFENMGVAVATALLYCLQAEIRYNQYLLSKMAAIFEIEGRVML